MVTFEAPGSRGDEGETRTIPAVVMGQWPDGSLQLYCFHFEGSFLKNSVPLECVKMVSLPATIADTTLRQKYAIRDAS
jgi:hypothetical protein